MLYRAFLIGLQVPAFFCFIYHSFRIKFIAFCPFPFLGGVIYRFSNSWFLVFFLVSHPFRLSTSSFPSFLTLGSVLLALFFVCLVTFRQEGV